MFGCIHTKYYTYYFEIVMLRSCLARAQNELDWRVPGALRELMHHHMFYLFYVDALVQH